jgi:hypothetical protein
MIFWHRDLNPCQAKEHNYDTSEPTGFCTDGRGKGRRPTHAPWKNKFFVTGGEQNPRASFISTAQTEKVDVNAVSF